MTYPLYIKGRTFPDANGIEHDEWLVRLVYDIGNHRCSEIGNQDRYYRLSNHIPKEISMLQGRKYISFDDIKKWVDYKGCWLNI